MPFSDALKQFRALLAAFQHIFVSISRLYLVTVVSALLIGPP